MPSAWSSTPSCCGRPATSTRPSPSSAPSHEIREEDIARLSPLKHRNLNVLGRYSFTASIPAAGALRPLSDPDAPELDEDETGQEGTRTKGPMTGRAADLQGLA